MSNYFDRTVSKSAQLIKALSSLYPELPYSLLMKLLRKKDIFVNSVRVGSDTKVYPNDLVSLFLLPKAVPLNVCYENDYIFCINKSKGIASDGKFSLESLVGYVYPKSVMIHRLDTNTEGIVLFAKNREVGEYLIDIMKSGEIEKTYRCTVYGEPRFKNTELKGYLYKDSSKGRVVIYHAPHKNAVAITTLCTTLSSHDGLTELSVTIHNGKTHQIRAHLADAGYFIIGDGKYGDDRINKLYGYKSQALKAVELKFSESVTKYGLSGLTISILH